MSGRFQLPSDGGSSPPATPDRGQRGRRQYFGDEPSTTPAGPPPSSAGSFTPAGAPTASYMGSSVMRGTINSTQKPNSTKKTLFGPKRSSPLSRSVRGAKAHQPSRLSRQVAMDDDDGEEEEEDEAEEPQKGGGTFKVSYDDTYDDEDEDEDDQDYEEEEDDYMEGEEEEEDDDRLELIRSRSRGALKQTQDDIWLGMDSVQSVPRGLMDDSVPDLLMMGSPARRVQREAEGLFRASAIQARARRDEHEFASIAKDVYTQMGLAVLEEEPELILRTEAMVDALYNEGVGAADDEEKLDLTLANVAGDLAEVWRDYADAFQTPENAQVADIGPSPDAPPFQKAYYLANLALQIHHSRFSSTNGVPEPEPLASALFRWLSEAHDPYPTQLDEVLAHRPSPACHSLFWPTLFMAILRGRVREALPLLSKSGFGHVRRGQHGSYAYTGATLENVQIAVNETCAMLEACPAVEGNWEIQGNAWSVFRVQARGALEGLRQFAENKNEVPGLDASTMSRQSMAGMARKAESQVPWEIYENLLIIFEIVLGSSKVIRDTAQDWCEATVGLFGWGSATQAGENRSMRLSKSQALVLLSSSHDERDSLERLVNAFHSAVGESFQLNTMSPIEVGLACIFEDNTSALLGILRGWSLPIASAVAEIASLGKWLPPHQPSPLEMPDLDMEDLEVLGMNPGVQEDTEGVKDSTLAHYARELAATDAFSYIQDKTTGEARDGWELAIQVLGRMDSSERSEQMVSELAENLLASLDSESGTTIEKIWRLMTDLGVIPLAEKAAEMYGDILAQESHRYGEAMWYYALAHRPTKVREVMNLLISYSLIQSTVYPKLSELDDYLLKLLRQRNETLEALAKQDLEAAELLGKMLSGYASLRQFYEIRDRNDGPSALTLHERRRQAAAALLSVIASADDNIRGGLFDQTRDGIVSEDFLLALLGEALVFVSDPDGPASSVALRPTGHQGAGPAMTLDHIDTLLKAIEDLQAVGERVFHSCNEFFQLVLASAPGGLRGSTPADLLRKSTAGSTGAGGSLVLSGSSLLASQLHRSISGGGLGRTNVQRGWDWRSQLVAGSTAEDVLKRLRLGLARDLAGLWLMSADAGW